MSRVLIVGSFAPTLPKFRLPLVRELLARGHEVIAWSPDDPECDHAARLAEVGARWECLPFARNQMTPFADLRTQREMRERMCALRPSHVLLYSAKPIVLGARAARDAGAGRVTAMVTGLGHLFMGRGLRGWLRASMGRVAYRSALSLCDAAVFHNEADRRAFEECHVWRGGAERTVVTAGSGVDLAEYPFAHWPSEAHPPRVLMAARFLRDKGVEEYLQAAALVRQHHPTVTFALAGFGDGGPSEVDAALIARAAARGDVDLLGRLPHLASALASAHIVVHPSYREGLSHVILEAAATGRPVITTDVPGCRDGVIIGETGLVVPPRDPRSLADAILVLLADPVRCRAMGLVAHANAERVFDARAVARVHADAILNATPSRERLDVSVGTDILSR